MIRRKDIEEREHKTLAPYAAMSAESHGRVYPQKEHPLRTVFQRDRDRIIHASAFRRMEYKTQVFVPHEGDHFRTRLTHTIEVAQISRTMARSLRLNEDLAEAIALVHDVGHTPFGHAGEDVLNELLADRGGFNHNLQSLRVVDVLEQRYEAHPGLNLSYEVREGIVKHETSMDIRHPDFDPKLRPTLEASLVDIADELAYNAHDIDDGVRSGLISLDDLRELGIWSDGGESLFDRLAIGSEAEADQVRYQLVRWLLNKTATDVLEETTRRLEEGEVVDLLSLRSSKEPLCGYSPELRAQVEELKSFLRGRLYRHSSLTEKADRARQVIEGLYRKLMADPEAMPARYREMLLTEDQETVIADYIAGMTDRYAEKRHAELTA